MSLPIKIRRFRLSLFLSLCLCLSLSFSISLSPSVCLSPTPRERPKECPYLLKSDDLGSLCFCLSVSDFVSLSVFLCLSVSVCLSLPNPQRTPKGMSLPIKIRRFRRLILFSVTPPPLFFFNGRVHFATVEEAVWAKSFVDYKDTSWTRTRCLTRYSTSPSVGRPWINSLYSVAAPACQVWINSRINTQGS